jgi:hypothetical protein
MWQETDAQRRQDRHFFEALPRFTAEKDPKKAGKQPRPEKPKKSKTEKSKTKKGSDKGSQDEKDLKTEG